MTPQSNDLGTFIRQRREARGVTLPHLADQIGVAKSLLLYWERGERMPKPPNLQKLATALGASFEDLFALAGYATPDDLPGLPVYLRQKVGLSEDEATRVERYVARIAKQPRKEQS
jgi:transcriptional regulator with XRE-family HTH domain